MRSISNVGRNRESPITVKCLTFDLDDTLWECESVIHRAEQTFYDWLAGQYPRISERYALDQLIEHRIAYFELFPDLQHDFTHLRKQWLTRLASENGYDTDLVEPAFRIFWLARNEVLVYEEAQEILAELSGRYRLGAITNGNADVYHIGIGHYFDFVITAATAGAAKPDALIFQCALDEAGVAAANAVHVGDDPIRDIQGAAAAGMRTVWVNPEAKPWPGGHRPDATIRGVGELREVLAVWTG